MWTYALDAYPAVVFPGAFLAAVGMVVGSYLNVVVYRLPAGISTVFPGSRCPRCLSPVAPWDNVPFFSYLWLAARCRSCGGSISIRYPLVELVTGFLFVASWLRFPTRPASILVSCGLVSCWIVVGLIDWDHRRVPLVPMLVALAVGLLSQPWLRWVTPTESLAGAAIGGIGIWAASRVWLQAAGEPGFGSGDAWMLAVIGAYLGPRGVLVCFALAAVISLPTTLAERWSRRSRSAQSVPFVTYLSVSALAYHFLGLPSP